MPTLRVEQLVRCEGVPIATVTDLRDASLPSGHPPDLVVEVPHGADRQAHYDALATRIHSPLPAALHEFFWANTDVGAWGYGALVAEQVVSAAPRRRVVIVRCLVPRTFVDTNRVIDAADELATGGLTPALAPYFSDPGDRTLLFSLHAAYTDLAAAWLDESLRAGGFALLPHTYGPRSTGLKVVDDKIVDNLRAVAAPGRWTSLPLRSEIDLLTRDADGELWAPARLVARVAAAFEKTGRQVTENDTYCLHPATQAWRWSRRFPEQVLCIEVRRDLLVADFSLLHAKTTDPAALAAIAAPLATEIDYWLRSRRSP